MGSVVLDHVVMSTAVPSRWASGGRAMEHSCRPNTAFRPQKERGPDHPVPHRAKEPQNRRLRSHRSRSPIARDTARRSRPCSSSRRGRHTGRRHEPETSRVTHTPTFAMSAEIRDAPDSLIPLAPPSACTRSSTFWSRRRQVGPHDHGEQRQIDPAPRSSRQGNNDPCGVSGSPAPSPRAGGSACGRTRRVARCVAKVLRRTSL